MKSVHRVFWKIWVVMGLLVAIGALNSTDAKGAGRAEVKVVRIKGSARYTIDQKKWKDLRRGTMLKSGTLIQTAAGTVVDICLNDEHAAKASAEGGAVTDDVIRLYENTVLSLDKMEPAELQLDLRNGSLMGTVGPLPPDAKYEIRVPHGFIGIRGGTYIADADGGMNVFEGSAVMVVIGADKSLSTKKLSERQGYDPATGTVVALHLQSYPLPLTCAGSELPNTPNASSPTSGLPHGPGMGGALRKF